MNDINIELLYQNGEIATLVLVALSKSPIKLKQRS